jgi:5-methylcytosine-specific restriction endonuclease McrA
MPRKRWDKLRGDVIKKSGSKCEICGSTDKLHCHEIWSYNDKSRVQKLMGFQTICNMCHFVKHVGLAQKLGQQGLLDYEAVIKHFLKVNKLKRPDFDAHRAEAIAVWEKRSKLKWKTELGSFERLIKGGTA